METILITGGSGTIGNRLSEILVERGYHVKHLSRSVSGNETYPTYKWDLSANYIDPEAVVDVDHIVHLAGENVSGGRWNETRKQRIITSRVDTANLLLHALNNKPIQSFISASGISFYGSKTTQNIYTETDRHGKDFLAEVSVAWEAAATRFEPVAKRVVILRTGVVLSPKEGALEKIIKPMKMGFGSPLGSGKQYMPWLHLEDICGMYVHAIENSSVHGIYNAAASQHCTNREFTKTLARVLGKKLWVPKVPAFMLRLLFGEMATIILEGSRIDNAKIKATGYSFQFDELEGALKDLLNK